MKNRGASQCYQPKVGEVRPIESYAAVSNTKTTHNDHFYLGNWWYNEADDDGDDADADADADAAAAAADDDDDDDNGDDDDDEPWEFVAS